MKIAVVGSGGREHALIKKLKESKNVQEIYALPGNGGIAADATCVPIGAKEVDRIVSFAKENKIDFVVVAPDDPLVLGTVDKLNEAGIAAFGPNKKAAAIEGSKAFAKELMKKYGIPTADYRIFDVQQEALDYLEHCDYPVVVKADGLALGKGVTVAADKNEAINAVHAMMEDKIFGASGNCVVIEEFLTGPEVSVLCFTDGKTVKPMVSSMDHKRAYDNDLGPNTGGMGTVAPNPFYTPEIAQRCMDEIFMPTVRAMEKEDRPFKGCLYFGLMITPQGPKVIEYNCRFGDPETQVVLPLLKSDLLSVMLACANGTLDTEPVEFAYRHAACVVSASEGYPVKYQVGYEITLPEILRDNEQIYIAGAKEENGNLYTSGGRVLGAVCVEDTLKDAISGAYALTDKIHFEKMFFRKDIGARALSVGE